MNKHYLNKSKTSIEWCAYLTELFFFKNQNDVFDCYLVILNDKVYLSYNPTIGLSQDYVDFLFNNLPKNPLDKKPRFFKKMYK